MAINTRAPDENDWVNLIGDEPVLILLDEMPPYFDNALTISVGSGNLAKVATYALSTLMSAALRLPRLCLVVSNLSGTYENASRELKRAVGDVLAEANRQARPITPVELGGNEIYEILRKRLFKELPASADIDRVADAFANGITEAEKSKSIGKSTEQIASEIHASYPFHPALKDVIAMFKENESFRQTRGLMRFVSRILKSVWERSTNDVFLIGTQHLTMTDSEVRDEVLNICNLQSAVAKDIADHGYAHAELINAKLSSDAGSQVSTLLMTASLSKNLDGIRGLDRQRTLEYLIAPHRDPLEFSEAFEELRKSAWYLHPGERGTFYFSDQENLTKRLEKEAEQAPENKIEEDMRRRLHTMFDPKTKSAYEQAIALPKLDDINLKGGRTLLILSPDAKIPPEEAKRLFDAAVEKNNFCIVAGDGSDLASLESAVRRAWAVAKVGKQLPDNHPQEAELESKREEAELDFRSTAIATFNRLYFPMKNGLKSAKFAITFQNNAWEGEAQVERTLRDTAASKLELDIAGKAEQLMQRAEEQLWPDGQHRVRWTDVIERSKTNPRWLWLPPKGLEELRRKAEAQGRWVYTDDGYIDKNPAKAKTSVVIQETHYDDTTGTATLKVSANHAGSRPVIHYAEDPNVSAQSPVLRELTLSTDQTRLFFLAVDPSGSHETGEIVEWKNKLTITHQPRERGDTRSVELKVVPRGRLRYTLDGTHPRSGTEYSAPFEIGLDETLIQVIAEDAGVETTRDFRIPKVGQTGPVIDAARPATLKRKLDFSGSAEVFMLLNHAKRAKGILHSVSFEIGQGDKAASVRFGSGSVISPESVERLIECVRSTLNDDAGHVSMGVRGIEFSTGHDLKEFLAEFGIKADASEVAQ